MAEYSWNALLLRRVFVVPEEVADTHLRLAGAVQLKVLLWLSRHGGRYDDEACSAAIGASVADCRDALRYWVDAGVLFGNDEEPAVSVPASAPITAPEKVTARAAARPATVKPQMPEVIARRKSCNEFAMLLDEVSARIGRPLSPGDMETLLYLFDTAGLPAEVILMVVGYAASAERCSMRYIEKIALDWADRGIVTMTAAEEYLCAIERAEQAVLRLQEICGMEKVPSGASVRDAAVTWICDRQTPEELLRMAYTVCLEKTGKFQVRYMARVLDNWRDQGVDTAEKATALCEGKLSAVPEDKHSEYEEMVAQYVPKYKKKKKG